MNDIIIYFKFAIDHFIHLNEAFNLLKKSKMTLSFLKCHFAYSNIKTLKHHVNRFNLNILKKNKYHSSFDVFQNFKKIRNRIEFFRLLEKICNMIRHHETIFNDI